MSQETSPNTQPTQNIQPAVDPLTESEFADSYKKRLPEILAIKEDELVTNNLDLEAAIAKALAALPDIRALGEEMAGLPKLDKTLVESLEDYTEAAAQAQLLYRAATTPPEDIVALNAEALRLREVLRSDAMALATRGLMDRGPFESFTGLTGYRNVGFELAGWAEVMRAAWARIGGKTALTSEELTHAKNVGERLIRAAGFHDKTPAEVAEVARIRHQAVTLLLRAYSEVQRAVVYLRWREKDAEKIAPSLFQARPRPRGKDATPADVDAPTQPGTPPAALAGAVTPAAAEPATNAIPQGMPGASPFLSH